MRMPGPGASANPPRRARVSPRRSAAAHVPWGRKEPKAPGQRCCERRDSAAATLSGWRKRAPPPDGTHPAPQPPRATSRPHRRRPVSVSCLSVEPRDRSRTVMPFNQCAAFHTTTTTQSLKATASSPRSKASAPPQAFKRQPRTVHADEARPWACTAFRPRSKLPLPCSVQASGRCQFGVALLLYLASFTLHGIQQPSTATSCPQHRGIATPTTARPSTPQPGSSARRSAQQWRRELCLLSSGGGEEHAYTGCRALA